MELLALQRRDVESDHAPWEGCVQVVTSMLERAGQLHSLVDWLV